MITAIGADDGNERGMLMQVVRCREIWQRGLLACVKEHRLAKEAKAEPGVASIDGHHKQDPADAALLLQVAEVGAVLGDQMYGQAAREERTPEHAEPDPLMRPEVLNYNYMRFAVRFGSSFVPPVCGVPLRRVCFLGVERHVAYGHDDESGRTEKKGGGASNRCNDNFKQ